MLLKRKYDKPNQNKLQYYIITPAFYILNLFCHLLEMCVTFYFSGLQGIGLTVLVCSK